VTAVGTALPGFTVVRVRYGAALAPTVSEIASDDSHFKSAQPVAGPAFLAAYFKRRDEQLQNEERLCSEVLEIPVSDDEVREIQIELGATFPVLLGEPHV